MGRIRGAPGFGPNRQEVQIRGGLSPGVRRVM